MRFRLALLAGLVAFASGANAQPTAAAALNSARYGIPGLPGYGVAQGSMATLFGTQYPAVSKVVTALPLTKVWETVAIQITVNGTTKDAYPLILQGAGQLSFIVPSDIPVGTGTITVTVNGVTGTPGPITILPRNFGIFTTNFTGSGPAVMLNPVTNAANSLTNAANSGDQLDIWGTGLGGVDAAQEANKPLPGDMALANVKVNVGGKDAQIIYKGRSGCCIGIDQIRFVVPAGVSGCYVPVYLTVNDTVSNFTTMSVATSGRTCSDAGIGYTSDDINRALSANGLKTGDVLLSRTTFKLSFEGMTAESKTDSGFGSFQKWNADLLNLSNNAGTGVTPIGSCIVYTQKSNDTTPNEVVTIPELDAGPALTVTSPGGTVKQLPKSTGSKGTYYGKLGGGITIPDFPIPIPGAEPPFLDPGVFKIAGPGGADVGAFNVSLNVPTALTWTDMDTVNTINRAQDFPVHFSGGGAGDLVVILGFSSISQPQEATASFICTTHATGGAVTFNVPSAVLMQLPANPPSTNPDDPSPTGLLMLGTTTNPVPFTATGLDKGIAVSSVQTGKTVTYQ